MLDPLRHIAPALRESIRLDPRLQDKKWSGKLYRFFGEHTYAEDFSKGKVYVSTLKKCRLTEDLSRKDIGEAVHQYLGGVAIGSEGDPWFEEIARRSGIDTRGARNWTINDCRSLHGIQVGDGIGVYPIRQHRCAASGSSHCHA